MILSKSQAEAVYSAMVALNNIGGRLNGTKFAHAGQTITCHEYASGRIVLCNGAEFERFDSQLSFALAYEVAQ